MNKIYPLIVLLMTCLLMGCSYEDKRADLQDYINQIKQRPAGEVEPLPQIQPYETFSYTAMTLRSPFMPPEPEKVIAPVLVDNGIRPDAHRRKELLETYPIDSLKMVGTLERGGFIWALIVDKEGALHRITKGNYVGMNHGQIKKITEEKLFITEIVPNPTGGWQEREAEMALIVEEE